MLELLRLRLIMNRLLSGGGGGGGGGGVLGGGGYSGGGGGGPTYFFGLKIYTLDIFLGQEICHEFFWVLSPSELFVSGFRCDRWIRKIFIRIKSG